MELGYHQGREREVVAASSTTEQNKAAKNVTRIGEGKANAGKNLTKIGEKKPHQNPGCWCWELRGIPAPEQDEMRRSEGKAALPAHDFVITLPVLAVDFKAQLWELWDSQELGLQQKVHGETSCFARGKTNQN